MRRTYSRSVGTLALVLVAHTSIGRATHSPKPIPLSAFTHTLTREAAVKLFGASQFVDSVYEREGRSTDRTILVFAPVAIEGYPAIARARVSGDTVDRIEFYLTYHEHPTSKPSEPYVDRGFVHATPDDLTQLRARLTARFGEPSIMSETFFEYVGSSALPSLRAQYRDRCIVVSVAASGIL